MEELVNHNRIYVVTREEWRQWLADNHTTAVEIWLVYPRKQSGKPRIPYNDAVEEALCFGWIDSITKTVDIDHYSQRFTPRKAKSGYSQTNIERLRRLITQDKVLPHIVAQTEDVLAAEFVFPADIKAVLQANKPAWQNFQALFGRLSTNSRRLCRITPTKAGRV